MYSLVPILSWRILWKGGMSSNENIDKSFCWLKNINFYEVDFECTVKSW